MESALTRLAPACIDTPHLKLVHRLAPFAGLAVLGVGDAVASIVGVNFGRCRWPGTQKTVEGSIAGGVAIIALLMCVDRVDGVHAASLLEWSLVVVCTILVCILEAFTTQIDNLFLPLVFYASLLSVSVLS